MVDAVTGRYFGDSIAAAGWVVVSPAAPQLVESSDDGRFFYQDPEPLTQLLDLLEGVVVPEGGRWHVAGPSNGGLSAFRFATDHPDRVASLMGLPGYPASPASTTADMALLDIPVVLYVGGDDPTWREPMEAFAATFREAGGDVTLTVRPGQSHVIGDLSADELLEVLEGMRL
jgi:pimeloyl-ACP methyl ester carboxylesterase